MKTLLAGLIFAAIIGFIAIAIYADDSPDVWDHNSATLQVGIPTVLQTNTLWIEIKNISSKVISMKIPMGKVRIYAITINLQHPLYLSEVNPETIQIGKPNDVKTNLFEFNTIDIKNSKIVKLNPGEVILVTFDLRKMLKDCSWEWSSILKPPKSPIIDVNENIISEPIALWVELHSNNGRTPLRSRPVMISPKKLFGNPEKVEDIRQAERN